MRDVDRKWRIQDFPKGAPTYYLAIIFPENSMANLA